MNNKTSGKFRLDGLFRQNIVLMSGLVTAPIIVAATTFERALVLTLSFLLISYSSIIICRFIPREIVYTVRIICYVGVAAVMYIPTALLMNALFPETASAVSIYIEILVVNSLILAKTESRFYLMPLKEMALDALMYILGVRRGYHQGVPRVRLAVRAESMRRPHARRQDHVLRVHTCGDPRGGLPRSDYPPQEAQRKLRRYPKGG